MKDNVIQTENGIVIINGGNPLPGCPESWDDANAWETKANQNKEEYEDPLWKFDCGFKLDFDGPILSINSRFYPPTTHGGATWDGRVEIVLLGKKLEDRSFDCKTLNELKAEVEKYIEDIRGRLSLNPPLK